MIQSETKCEYCGLIQGHGNSCFVDVLYPKLKALEYVVERARILIDANNDHAKLVAEMKLKDAVNLLDIQIRRGREKV